MSRTGWLLLVSFALLTGCVRETEACRDGMPQCSADDAGLDGGREEDAAVPDAGACASPCEGATPFCDETTGACVPCRTDDDCTDERPSCGATGCVECRTSAQCGDAAASVCQDGACVGCTTDEDCAAIPGAALCETASRTCVQCTAADESACGETVCDVEARSCTTRPAGSSATCGRVSVGEAFEARPCVSDRECAAGSACVLTTFDAGLGAGDVRDVGYYCLPLAPTSGNCARPFVDRRNATNRAGEAVQICGPRLATCPAFVAHGSTACVDDDACGVPELDDGLCRPGSPDVADGLACTFRCASANDCPVGFSCNTSSESPFCCFGSSC